MEKVVQKEKQKTGLWERFVKCDRFIAGHKWLVLLVCAAVMVLITVLKYTLYDETGFADAYHIMQAANAGAIICAICCASV